MQATRRRPATKTRREAIIARDGDLCASEGCSERKGLELDHRVPLALGGLDELSNWRLMCKAHHSAKTAVDRKRIAKALAQAGETGNGYKRPIAQRPNPWPPRGSRELQGRKW